MPEQSHRFHNFFLLYHQLFSTALVWVICE